jgi:hypothetical protein
MASSFNKNLKVEFIGKTDDVKILDEIRYYSEGAFPGLVIILEPGFICDLESIPEGLKGIVRGSGNRYKRAYPFHDGLYRLWQYYEKENPRLAPPREHELIEEISQKKADQILDEELKVLGLGWYARSKIYWGLRMFGSPGKITPEKESNLAYIRLEKYDSILDAKESCQEAKLITGN